MLQLAAEPVEHGHKVVADALDARPAQPAQIFAVGVDHRGSFYRSELDVLGNGNAFHHFKLQVMRGSVSLDFGDAFVAPHAAGSDVIHRGNNAGHGGDLFNFFQRDGVFLAIPSEGHFHGKESFLFWIICKAARFGTRLLEKEIVFGRRICYTEGRKANPRRRAAGCRILIRVRIFIFTIPSTKLPAKRSL